MIRINEVGPRDGLQNEKNAIPTAVKVAYIDALSRTGVNEVEVTAFVSPKWVPQLADAEEVCAQIQRQPHVIYSALVPNTRGLERAARARLDRISVFTATSETFSHKNVNTSIEGSMARFRPVLAHARELGLSVRGYISTAFWCPYEGRMAPELSLDLAQRLLDMGIEIVSISDTIGKAVPDEVRELLDVVLPAVPRERIAMHFHDTYGNGASNVLAAYEMGIEDFDSSAGGIGGCPFAPGARGNVGTELVYRTLKGAGADFALDLGPLSEARQVIGPAIGRDVDGVYLPTLNEDTD